MAVDNKLVANIKMPKKTAVEWERLNPIITDKQLIAVETTNTGIRFKLGDGIKHYSQLPFVDESLYSTIASKAEKNHNHDGIYQPIGDYLKADDIKNVEPKIFNSYDEAVDYAFSDKNAYVGQTLTVVNQANNLVTVYVIANSRMEIQPVGSSANVSDYNTLINKPQINGVTLVGNKLSEDLNIDVVSMSNTDIEAIFLS